MNRVNLKEDNSGTDKSENHEDSRGDISEEGKYEQINSGKIKLRKW